MYDKLVKVITIPVLETDFEADEPETWQHTGMYGCPCVFDDPEIPLEVLKFIAMILKDEIDYRQSEEYKPHKTYDELSCENSQLMKKNKELKKQIKELKKGR